MVGSICFGNAFLTANNICMIAPANITVAFVKLNTVPLLAWPLPCFRPKMLLGDGSSTLGGKVSPQLCPLRVGRFLVNLGGYVSFRHRIQILRNFDPGGPRHGGNDSDLLELLFSAFHEHIAHKTIGHFSIYFHYVFIVLYHLCKLSSPALIWCFRIHALCPLKEGKLLAERDYIFYYAESSVYVNILCLAVCICVCVRSYEHRSIWEGT